MCVSGVGGAGVTNKNEQYENTAINGQWFNNPSLGAQNKTAS